MGKKERELYAMILAEMRKMNEPKSNPAQEYLTNMALEGARTMQAGEFSQGKLPKGMFFNFDQPAEAIDRYKKMANVGQGGTFALGDNAGRGQAAALQNKYLQDRFARDASQNYQNNIANAGMNINNALQQASGYQTNQQANIMNALQGLYSTQANKPSKWGNILGMVGTLGSAIL